MEQTIEDRELKSPMIISNSKNPLLWQVSDCGLITLPSIGTLVIGDTFNITYDDKIIKIVVEKKEK